MPKGHYQRTSGRERIERGSAPCPMSGCWIWTKALIPSGYGTVTLSGRFVAAHRLAYQEFVGPIPDGMNVLHRCDNRACVNPAHLFLGTNSDNMRDMVNKGRDGTWRRPTTKLKPEDVSAIRGAAANGKSCVELSRRYGVCAAHIGKIVSRAKWSRVS